MRRCGQHLLLSCPGSWLHRHARVSGALAPVPAYQVPHGKPMSRVGSKEVLLDEQRQVLAKPRTLFNCCHACTAVGPHHGVRQQCAAPESCSIWSPFPHLIQHSCCRFDMQAIKAVRDSLR